MTKWFPNGVDNQKLGSLARFNPRAEWEAFGPGTNKQVIAYLAGSGGQTPQPATLDLTYLTVAGAAQGDIIYYNGTNWVRLAAGTAGQTLRTLGAAANPAWGAPAWTAWTPTITAAVGTFTTVSGSGAYLLDGKVLTFRLLISITDPGTAAGAINIPLPNSLTANGAQSVSATTSGFIAGSAWVQTSSNTLQLEKFDNTTIIGPGVFPILNGVIEVN